MQKLPINPFLDFYATPDAMIINPFVFGGGAFDPLSLSPALWLDASDASTLYDAVSGGSLVAADGEISRIEDKSGNARHATQSTSGFRPLRKTGILNGKDVARFDGADDGLAGVLVNSSAMSVFAVFSPILDSTATAAFARVYSQRAAGSDDFNQTGHYIPILRDNLTDGFGSFASGAMRLLQNATASTAEVMGSIHSGAQITNYRNGTASSAYAHTLGSNGVAYAVGQAVNRVSTGFFKGDIAEILVFPTALGTTDRQNVENYLNAKYAIY